MANFKLTDEREYFKPFNYPWAYEAWLKHEQSHWLHTEVPMAEDVKDWQRKLSIEEKGFLTNIFRFFTQGRTSTLLAVMLTTISHTSSNQKSA